MLKKLEKRGKVTLARLVSFFLRTGKISAEEFSRTRIDRLLLIRQHNQMGDMLMAVPAFRGLRNRFDTARISLIAASINTDVMLNNPYIDEVLTYAKEKNRTKPLRLIGFIMSLRRRRFDAVIVLNTVSFSITSMLLAVVSGARIRIGSTSRPFGHDLSSRFYHLELPLPSRDELAGMHESEHSLYPLSVIGVHERDLTSILVPTESEKLDSESLISTAFDAGSDFIVIHPGAGKRQNVWPPENFADVARMMSERHSMGAVVVVGPVDHEVLDRFLGSCRTSVVVLSCPSVGFLGALMKRAALTFCNDTGIMHIAGAVGVKCIAVFGPTDPSRWKPLNDKVVAVRSRDKRVDSVGVDEVFLLAEKML